MLLVLPPSETKRDGGLDGTRLQLDALGFGSLAPQRAAVLSALTRLSRSVGESMAALDLGPTQRAEIDRNRAIRTSPVLPAIERYTGVLYDGLDAASLTPAGRTFAAQHVAVHSALWGLLRADDPIPAYRLSHDSRLPGISLRRHWREPITAELATRPEFVVDLRSESYVALGPTGPGGWYVRVVAESPSGRRLALSHFNKKAKGEFARAVIEAGVDHGTVDSLVDWARGCGICLEIVGEGLVELVV